MSETAFDHALALEILHQIHWSTETILKRFAPIASPDDFLDIYEYYVAPLASVVAQMIDELAQ